MSTALAGGRYVVERELGHGGMATVYLAHDEELDRRVALKLLAEHLTGDESFRARFLREARLAARLSHLNIVQVYDAGEAGERPFIVMEYVAGGTLADCGRISVEGVAELGRQACAGLQHAHAAGLVHRDVKPGNLLLRDDGVLKITDFGIARAVEATRHTLPGTILGTAAYLAPEQISGGDATTESDLYSLGAVLFELLTGRPPYVFESLSELAASQADGGAIPPVRDLRSDVPLQLERAVMHALARDPRFRPQSASELAGELAAVAAPEPPTKPLPRQSVVAKHRRRWVLWFAAAAVAATIAVVLGLLGLGGSSGHEPKAAPPHVSAPARGSSAAEEAGNLARWLRAHSR
jgi:eukaryotic-like serine/threonine-protein kinase